MSFVNIAICLFLSVSLALGQVFFRYAAAYNLTLRGGLLSKILHNYILFGAFAWYAASSLLYFYMLTRAPLNRVYPFAILGSGLVPLLGWLLFDEAVGLTFFLGYFLMLGGLALIFADR
jgi:uncharacterized membrane protein